MGLFSFVIHHKINLSNNLKKKKLLDRNESRKVVCMRACTHVYRRAAGMRAVRARPVQAPYADVCVHAWVLAWVRGVHVCVCVFKEAYHVMTSDLGKLCWYNCRSQAQKTITITEVLACNYT